MPRYIPSFVDTSGFVKAMNDEAYRNYALALKREDGLNKHADNFLSSYTNKIRPNDLPKFHEMWLDWKNTGKSYMKENRSNVASDGLTINSLTKDEKFASMSAFVEKSIAWKGKQAISAKMFKDPSKIVDTEKYIKLQDDFGSRTSDELDEIYGTADKVDLSDFEYKPDPVKIDVINRGIKSGILNPTYNGIKKIPTMDTANPNNRVKVTRTIESGKLKAVFDVPQTTLVLGPEPNDIYSSTLRASINPGAMETYKYFHKNIMDGLNDQNPAVQQASQVAVDKAMKMFNITDLKNVTPQHLYASSLIDDNMYGTIQIDDWSDIDDMLDRFAKMNRLKKDDLQMQKLRKDLMDSNKTDAIKQLSTLLTVAGKVYTTGVFGQGDWGTHITNVIKSQYPNLNFEQKTLDAMGVWRFNQGIDMFQNWMKTQGQNQPGNGAGYNPSNPSNSRR